MTGSLYYEVTASGRRVALCVDKADAEIVAQHWYDGQVREAVNTWIVEAMPVTPGFTHTWTFPQTVGTAAPTLPEAKRKEDTQP